LITGRLIALIDRKKKKGRWEGGRARRESRGGAGSGGSGRKKKGRGEGEADRRGPGVSISVKKKKERGRGGPARENRWAAGPKREPVLVFLFFFFFSKLHFQTKFISNSNQTFQTFSQEFYRLFRNLTSNQKPCKPTDDAHTLVVSKFIKLYLIF
jgi:hypothetical protein